MSVVGGGSDQDLICAQASSTTCTDLPPVFGHPPHPYGINHDSHFIPPPSSSLGSCHPQFNTSLGQYHQDSVPIHFNSSFTTDHVSAQFLPPQYPQHQIPLQQHQLHPSHPQHPATHQLSTSNLPFIKQECQDGLPFIKQEPGLPFIKQEPGVNSWEASFDHVGGNLPPFTHTGMDMPSFTCTGGVPSFTHVPSSNHIGPTNHLKGGLHVKSEPQDSVLVPTIKQEPGVAVTSSHISGGSKVKQEPGIFAHNSNSETAVCAYGSQLPPKNEGCTGISFPSQPLNLNFMADIEDIVPPTTPELTIHSIQQELSSFDGPSEVDVKVGHRVVGVLREEEEEEDWEPPLWKQQYENIRTMRSKRDAPVDKYGCFMNAEKEVPPEVRRYQVLVSLMLSSQTKDEVVSKAMTKLKGNGLTISSVTNTPQEEIARMIFPVGFWNKKAEYIKKTTAILDAKFGGDIPNSVQGLVSLPGIGPKMAHLIMDFAWGEVSGIAVDTHVHRITHRLGWMRREARNPEEARKSLEKWLPKSEWSDLNLLCVGFGQQVCTPVSPKCSECLNKDLCPSSSCLVSTGLPLGVGIEVSTKSKSKKAKSTPISANNRQSKKIKIEKN